jgi:hypothetical protein
MVLRGATSLRVSNDVAPLKTIKAPSTSAIKTTCTLVVLCTRVLLCSVVVCCCV